MKTHVKSIWFLLGFLSAVILPLSNSSIAAEVSLLWDANNEADLAGYTLYQSTGFSGPPYDLIEDISLDELADPDNPEVIVTQLESGEKYYFVVAAYDKSNNESSFSNKICIQIEGSSIRDCLPAISSGGGGGSAGCFISTLVDGFRW